MEEAIKKEVSRQTIAAKKELKDFVNYILEEMRMKTAAAPEDKIIALRFHPESQCTASIVPKPEKEENPLGGLFARTHTHRKDLIYLTSMCTKIKEAGVVYPRGAVQKAARDLNLKLKIAPNNSGRTAGYEMISLADGEKLLRYMQKTYKN